MATYISLSSGNWSSASTWLTAFSGLGSPSFPLSAAGQPPQSNGGDKIIIRSGHVVTYDVNGIFGDGTSVYPTALSLTNLSANAICLSGGTLKASRSVSTSLTANGTIALNYFGAYFDWGTTSDPVSGVTASIVLGSPSDTTVFKNGIYGLNSTSPDNGIDNHKITIVGKTKTRNTQLSVSHSAGTSALSVLNCDGWEIGDKIVVEVPLLSSTAIPNTVGNITNINGNIITIDTTLNRNCLSGIYVGNLSSNLTIRPGLTSVSVGANCNSFGFRFDLNGNNSLYEFKNFSIENFNGIPTNGAIINIGATYGRRNVTIDGVAFSSVSAINGITWNAGVGYPHVIKNIAYYSTGTTSYFSTYAVGAAINISDCVIYRSGTMSNMVNCLEVNWDNVRSYSTVNTFGAQLYSTRSNITNCNFRVNSLANTANILVLSYYNQKYTFNNCYFQGITNTGGSGAMMFASESSSYTMEFKNCTLSSVSIPIAGLVTAKPFAANFYSLNNNKLDNRRVNSYYSLSGNYLLRNRGLASYEVVSVKTNVQHYFTETTPAKANIPQRYIGYLRYQSAYGNTNLPYIQFTDDNSTASVTQTFSCSPIPDQWQKFDLTVTPASDGNIRMSVYSQTSSTTARIYLDGLLFDPICPNARHYGFVFDTFPYKTVNTLTTLTENQVSALDVVTNLDYLHDAANYWSVTNPSLTSYTDLFTINGTVLDFGNINITVTSNVGTGFAYNSASNTIIINTNSLSAGNNFNALKTTGNLILSGTSTVSNITLNASLSQLTPIDLTGVVITGQLTYNTNVASQITYTNCTVTSATNVGSANITIKKINSTITYV